MPSFSFICSFIFTFLSRMTTVLMLLVYYTLFLYDRSFLTMSHYGLVTQPY